MSYANRLGYCAPIAVAIRSSLSLGTFQSGLRRRAIKGALLLCLIAVAASAQTATATTIQSSLETATLSHTVIAGTSTPSSTIAYLPNVQINVAKVGASGNIFIGGQTTTSAGSGMAYIAKLTPNGAAVYAVTLGGRGSSTSAATALAIDSAGAVYVAGTTTASDFPVSAGAVQSTGATAFAAKLDQNGNIVYSALIGGNAATQPSSVVVNSTNELVVSGQLTSGPTQSAVTTLFLFKLSADGTQAVAGPQGIGGLVAADAQDNIYVAGVPPGASNGPAATPGAFQGVPAISYCGCPFFDFACGGNQFVASLTPDLSQTRFLTYVTAKYGAVPAYLAVDAQGDILIAGTTSAPSYPTTSASYQPNYTAASGTELTCGPPISMEFTSPSGYVTLVKPDGSGLIFSTFFSGSKTDTVGFAALTSAGIYLAGQASSMDLPGFDGAVPSPCVPVGFVTRMTLDGSAISTSRTPQGTPLAYDSTTGTLLLASGNNLLRFDLSQETPIACVLDSADLSPVTAVAPGKLLSFFGRFPDYETDLSPVAVNPVNGSFPATFPGLGVAANQTPAPLLYVSEPQINFQAPYEIAGSPQTNLTVTYSDANGNSVSDSRTLNVAASNPVVFLSQPSSVNQAFPLTLNADGTVNSLTQPAAAGSIVSIFIDGLGVTSPAPVTGLVNTSPPAVLNVPLVVMPFCQDTYCPPIPAIVSATPLVGAISGVTQVQLRAPANPNPPYAFQSIFSLSVGSKAIWDMNLSFWVE
jgi:uncharacterized protein (TIGR03437 family)